MSDKFTAALKAFADKTKAAMNDVAIQSAIDVCSAVPPRTPIDTGLARNSFVSQINSPATEGPNPADAPFPRNGQWSIDGVKAVAPQLPGNVLYFTSNLDYIRKLEYGTIRLRPGNTPGMIRLSVVEWQMYVRKNIERVKGK